MLLGEWREWWETSGEQQLSDLLRENWDPFEDEGFRVQAQEQLLPLAKQLHEGATRVDVQVFLHDLRTTQWPKRVGRKWTSRDRSVAKKIVAWYQEATGEQPAER
jgi:hypothetical protein